VVKRLLLLGSVALAAGCGGGDPAADVVGQPAAVTTLDVQTRVFTPRCALAGCHAGTGAAMDLDLSSVSATRATAVGVASSEVPALMRVAPNDAPNSYLYRKVTAAPGILGDPMPLSGGPLTPTELAWIETWIEQGAR
jgi:hypothetical protein